MYTYKTVKIYEFSPLHPSRQRLLSIFSILNRQFNLYALCLSFLQKISAFIFDASYGMVVFYF